MLGFLERWWPRQKNDGDGVENTKSVDHYYSSIAKVMSNDILVIVDDSGLTHRESVVRRKDFRDSEPGDA